MAETLKVTTKVMNTSETKMTCPFKGGPNKNHKGVDLIPHSTAETPEILAYDDGVVMYVGNYGATNSNKGSAAMGTAVAIRHRDGSITRYQHMKQNSLRVKKGDTVRKGQPLGLYGRPTTGFSTGMHLHWDISFPTKPSCSYIQSTFAGETRYYVDPVPYLTKKSGVNPSTPSQSGNTYTVTASSLRIRSGPGTQYNTVGYLKNGQTVTITKESNGFGKMKSGWCSMQYLRKV